MTKRTFGLLLFALLVSGCDDLGLPAAKDFRVSQWYDSGADTLLDGAKRVSAWTHMNERYLTIRCFKGRHADAVPGYDLRYEIDVPLLERAAKELEKADNLTAAIAVDGIALGFPKARAGFQHGQLWFLIDVDETIIKAMADAQKDINVVPREGDKKLDKIIGFSSAGLAERIKPVMTACAKEAKEPPNAAPAEGVASR